MKQHRPSLLLALAAALAILGVMAFLQDREDALGRLRASGVIRIGYAVEPPFAMLAAGGEVTGEAPEIARHVVERLHIQRIEWFQTEFGNLIPDLEAGRIDVIAAGLFITPERSTRVLFSRSTMRVRQAMLVPAGNPEGLLSYADAARRQNIRLAVLAGSVEESAMQRLAIDAKRLLRVPDVLTGRKAVETRLAHALLLSEPSLRWMLMSRQVGGFDVIVSPDDGQSDSGLPAFAFRQQEPELRDAWDEVMRDYLGTDGHRAVLSRFGLNWSPPHEQGNSQ